jgi:Tfp pilus assembly protein PilF
MPEDQTYHLHLGLAYQKLADQQRAKAEFEQAISIDPKSVAADEARRAIRELHTS